MSRIKQIRCAWYAMQLITRYPTWFGVKDDWTMEQAASVRAMIRAEGSADGDYGLWLTEKEHLIHTSALFDVFYAMCATMGRHRRQDNEVVASRYRAAFEQINERERVIGNTWAPLLVGLQIGWLHASDYDELATHLTGASPHIVVDQRRVRRWLRRIDRREPEHSDAHIPVIGI